MPCPACKVIINGGFIEPLANQLLIETADDGVRKSAIKLSSAARTFNAVVTVARENGLSHKHERPDFAGCEQATALLAWIERAKGHLDDSQSPTTETMREKMHEWTVELHAATLAIVSGREIK